MKKIIIILVLLIPIKIYACCEMQGGFSGNYNEEGYAICMDETTSYENECRKNSLDNVKPIYGCMDKSAKNYSKSATINDNSCIYPIYGCTNKDAYNFNNQAEVDDGSCIPKIYGCTDKFAVNYKKDANIDDGSCKIITEIEKIVEIPFKTIYRKDFNIDLYTEKVLNEGKNGRRKIRYKVSLDSKGKELEKIKLEEVILENPQDKIVLQGIDDSMKNFTILLYFITISIYIFNKIFIKKCKDKNNYLIMFFKHDNKYLNALYNIIYILIIFPVFIDFIWIIKEYLIKKI